MGWRTIVIQQHAKVSVLSHNLIIQTNKDVNHVSIKDVQILVIDSLQVVLTAAAICELTQCNAKIIFTGHRHEPVCETTSISSYNRTIEAIETQINWYQDDMKKQLAWTKIVTAKIQTQQKLLKQKNLLYEFIDHELDELTVNDGSNREAVVAKKYFKLLFGADFTRDDLSHTNAALNYGYSLLVSCLNLSIVKQGFLTQLGIHHCNQENPYNLSYDLIEPFRPIVDNWVASKKFYDFTPDIKYGLIRLLDAKVEYNHKNYTLRTALDYHARQCMQFLTADRKIEIEVNFTSEVSNNAFNDYV